MPLMSVTPIETTALNLYICNEQLSRFGLKAGTSIKLHAGSHIVTVNIINNPAGNFISQTVLDTLGLPKMTTLKIKLEDKENLRIGPIIGILVPKGKRRKPPYSAQGQVLKNFLMYCMSRNYFAYVFFPESVNTTEENVQGLYLYVNENGTITWKKHCFPLPDAVYDRILHRTIEKKPAIKKVKTFLISDKTIPYFNPKFLDKWETHSIIGNDPCLKSHLPATVTHVRPEVISEMIRNYMTVYLKPIHGSLGQGIFRITAAPNGYCAQHRRGKKTFTVNFKEPREWLNSLSAFNKDIPYIVQQGLNLLKYKERVFDLRVLVQKDGIGQWIITAMVARVAPDGSIFPNIAAGGEAVSMENVWQELFATSWSASKTCKLTKQISLNAAKALEQALGTFGEIGLDIGIDHEGNIWIIEINSKPSRKVFAKNQIELKKKSLHMPMDFAAYLAGFSPKQELNDNEP